jgi:hypothetical protein
MARRRDDDPPLRSKPLEQMHVLVIHEHIVPGISGQPSIDALAQERETIEVFLVAGCQQCNVMHESRSG